MSPLSDEAKWSIISTFKSTNSIAKTARDCHVTRVTAAKWVKRYKTTKSVHKLKPGGRKAAISKEAAKAALELLATEEAGAADQAARKLKQQGLTTDLVHKSTIIRHAKAAATTSGSKLWADRGKPRKELTQQTRAKRLSFAQNNLSRQWASVMFTDRKKFLLQYPGSKVKMVRWVYGEAKDSPSAKAHQPNHPQCVNIYAGISKHGVTKVHVVAGTSKHTSSFTNKKGEPAKNITQQEYKAVLENTLLPEGKRVFTTAGLSSWWLQQDNDPSHSKAPDVVKAWSAANAVHVRVLPNWPPNSPDLNLIENVWGWVQARVNEKGCSSFEDFQQEVKLQFKAVPKAMLTNLYKSMPKRLKQVIESGGDKTRY